MAVEEEEEEEGGGGGDDAGALPALGNDVTLTEVQGNEAEYPAAEIAA